VTDQNGVTTYANTNENLEAIVVVYDPNGGYTYGGGSFASPAGALKSNPTAAGDVSYGFTVNYYKGAANPKGETQFEFKLGDIEFNAVNFDYLSISGAKAQFKGSGRIIGDQSGYAFIMTVTDGQLDGSGTDRIRIKIYNKNTDEVIYDNQQGASDAEGPVTPVNANSSVIIRNTLNTIITQREIITQPIEIIDQLQVKAIPNPAKSNFIISVKTNNISDKITMQVTDMYGRLIELKTVAANQVVRFGDKYVSGTYFVKITQGRNQQQLKLIKLSD
jgi:hypothetical protein